MEQAANKAIVRRWYEAAFNHTGDLGVIDEFIAADFVDHSAPPGLPAGREGFRTQVLTWRHAFPDITLRIDELLGADDTVVIAWTCTGTHRGELMGIPRRELPVRPAVSSSTGWPMDGLPSAGATAMTLASSNNSALSLGPNHQQSSVYRSFTV